MHREQSAQLEVEVHWDRGESLVIVRGDLDGISSVDLAERLLEIDDVLKVLNGRPRRLVVDLAGVGFANQAAVRALVGTRRRLSAGCVLQLRSPSRAVRRVLAPSGLLDDGHRVNGQVSRAPDHDQASSAAGRHRSRR